MSDAVPLKDWPDRIEAVMKQRCKLLARVTVLRETDSTQDAARRMNARPGDVITTARQTAGRGRLGRAWIDTVDEGAAVTMVVQRREPALLAIAAAVATAKAIDSVAPISTQIKWPNDVLIRGRKVAGVLIEQHDDVALIGVGINVSQMHWPPELAGRAASLAQFGAQVDRVEMIAELIAAMDETLQTTEKELIDEFAKRDSLRSTQATFSSSGGTISGRVVRIDPMRGIELELPSGEVRLLPAAITSVLTCELNRASFDASDDSALSAGNPVPHRPVNR